METYTANFAIRNVTRSAIALAAYNESTGPNSLEAPPALLTLVLPNTTIVSTLSPTPSGQFPASTTVYADSFRNTRTRNGERTRSGRVDLETVSFRIMFILWPALVGILMAL